MLGWPTMRKLKAAMMRHVPGMLTCAEFEAFVIEYHEGTLDRRARAVFERHMRLCRPCRISFDAYCTTVALGQRLFAAEAGQRPAPVEQHLVASILEARRRELG